MVLWVFIDMFIFVTKERSYDTTATIATTIAGLDEDSNICWKFEGAMTNGEIVDRECEIIGRYLQIKNYITENLNFNEVQAYGCSKL